jgi:hypothetical protein
LSETELDTNDLIQLLIAEKKFSDENVERLADIFFILAMYEYVEAINPAYSINRHLKIEQIRDEFCSG